MAAPLNNGSPNEHVSKTRRKKELNILQELGKELTNLPNDTLRQMSLTTELLTAILDYKRFPSHGAKKRQEQYIGRLMRNIDAEPIRHQLAAIKGESSEHIAWLHMLERWRDRLLSDDDMLIAFLNDFPAGDTQHLRTLIRNARKEQQQQTPPKSFRQLFQVLKDLIPQPTPSKFHTDS